MPWDESTGDANHYCEDCGRKVRSMVVCNTTVMECDACDVTTFSEVK